jgi:hypothetical protein
VRPCLGHQVRKPLVAQGEVLLVQEHKSQGLGFSGADLVEDGAGEGAAGEEAVPLKVFVRIAGLYVLDGGEGDGALPSPFPDIAQLVELVNVEEGGVGAAPVTALDGVQALGVKRGGKKGWEGGVL